MPVMHSNMLLMSELILVIPMALDKRPVSGRTYLSETEKLSS